MLPALRDGDWLIARRTRRIRAGQVVVAWHPSRDGLMLVKRATRRVEGGWWLESDFPQAPGATDSSVFGPVPADKVIGPVLARYGRKSKSISSGRNDPTEGHRAPRSLPAKTLAALARFGVPGRACERPRSSR
jgi:nickel-type superoxide dismutase maturation protease